MITKTVCVVVYACDGMHNKWLWILCYHLLLLLRMHLIFNSIESVTACANLIKYENAICYAIIIVIKLIEGFSFWCIGCWLCVVCYFAVYVWVWWMVMFYGLPLCMLKFCVKLITQSITFWWFNFKSTFSNSEFLFGDNPFGLKLANDIK